MPLEPGVRLGPYEIVSALGAGGMGEVYKARDSRLNRTVALKVLPAELASDPDRRSRFEREAHAIAALSHPHICTIHDVGRDNGIDYLVMELLDGETLADRLGRSKGRPLPITEVLRYATEIADALDKAHRAGIVHRDLKPANIMLTKSGAKLLDFGLAKLKGPAVPISMTAIEHATTTSGPKTATGTILGTVHYMSPEQVEGKEADARSDIWALGVVIYEMATGARPFDGESAASIIGAILKDNPPPLSSRQPLAPDALDHAVARCLAREPDDRWQSAADLGSTLRWIASTHASASSQSTSNPQTYRSRWALVGAGLLMTFAAGIAVGWRYLAPIPPPPPVVQFDVLPPIDAKLSPAPVASVPQIAISPDGRQVAFVAAKRRSLSQIYLRSIDGSEVRVLADTDGASFPFWSPDGRFLAFFAGGKLKKIAVAGGVAQVLCDAPAGRGGSWSADGVIIFSATPNAGLSSISSEGGPISAATTNNQTEHAIGHNWGQFLPDGRHFLYYQRAGDANFQGIFVGELGQTSHSARVLAISGMAVYSDRHLAYVRDGVLFVQAFDERTFKVSGEAIRIADHVGYFSGSFGYSAIAAAGGVLAYGPAVDTATALEWFTRDGKSAGRLGKPGVYTSPRFSFDQKTVAVAASGETMAERDLWNFDVARNAPSRMTSDPAADWFPAWSPDGSQIYFGSTRLGITSVFHKAGAGQDEKLDAAQPRFATYPADVSADGRLLLCTQSTETGYDLVVTPLADPSKVVPFLVTRFNEAQARFAPNTRWIAYASDESGQYDVYVRPYPAANTQARISLSGGMQPEWRRDGKELFYVAADGKMMAVPVSITGATFEAGTPTPLFSVEVPEATAPYPGHYAVTADGQRFLVNTVIDQPTRPALTVVLNWTAGLKK
jgi:serine/threonine protein kinase/Tol biopolymer transport system component